MNGHMLWRGTTRSIVSPSSQISTETSSSALVTMKRGVARIHESGAPTPSTCSSDHDNCLAEPTLRGIIPQSAWRFSNGGEVGLVATTDDNTVQRLLCHLAWLRDTVRGSAKLRTLEWARRVYISATHLQFRFVYPIRSQDRVDTVSQASLAKALEAIVSAADLAVEPLRSGARQAEANTRLDSHTAHELLDALDALLITANQIGWGGVHAPKEDRSLDRPVNPLRLLSEWRRRHRDHRRVHLNTMSGSQASDDPMAELRKGVVTKIVADHSRVMSRLPAQASRLLHEVVDAYLMVDVDELGRAGGEQLIQRLAARLIRPRPGRSM